MSSIDELKPEKYIVLGTITNPNKPIPISGNTSHSSGLRLLSTLCAEVDTITVDITEAIRTPMGPNNG